MSEQNQPEQYSQFKKVSLKDITEYASSRTELYDKLSKVYDLPICNSTLTLNYLKTLITNPCPYFKIKRTKTRPLPDKSWKCFDSRDTLRSLETLLKKHKLKPTGFTTF